MMNYRYNKLAFVVLGASMLAAANEANAFRSYTNDINDTCASLGYELRSEYVSDSCTACHRDSQAKSAYNVGDYEYFCPAPAQTVCTDADGDGYFAEGESCGTLADFNDDEAAAYPGASEDCADGIDNDGNGLVDGADPNAVGCVVPCTDNDMDGYATEGGSCGAIDCDDNDDSVNPGAAEICSDGVDNNCNGLTDTADMNAVDCPLDCSDNDGDGYSIEGGSCGAMDCDDNNAEVNPGALEICDDGVDNNCNSQIDSVDAVCQSDDTDDHNCQVPWWRSKGKHHHGHQNAGGDTGHDEHGGSDDEHHQSEGAEDHEVDHGRGKQGYGGMPDHHDDYRSWFWSLRR